MYNIIVHVVRSYYYTRVADNNERTNTIRYQVVLRHDILQPSAMRRGRWRAGRTNVKHLSTRLRTP